MNPKITSSRLRPDGSNRYPDRHGEKTAAHKLASWEVTMIRTCYQSGKWSQQNLATIFHVSQACVWQIVRRKTWTNQDQEEV